MDHRDFSSFALRTTGIVHLPQSRELLKSMAGWPNPRGRWIDLSVSKKDEHQLKRLMQAT